MDVADPRSGDDAVANETPRRAAGAPVPPPPPPFPAPVGELMVADSLAEMLPPPSGTGPTLVADLDTEPQVGAMFTGGSRTTAPGHGTGTVSTPQRMPMLPFRVLGIAGVALAFVLYGWQVFRVIDEQRRLPVLEWAPLLAGAIGALGVVLWTYVVVENARRIYLPARVSEPPEPGRAVSAWIVPIVYSAAAAVTISELSRRYNTPVEGAESSLPLILAIVALLVAFPMMYTPVINLSHVSRRIGGRSIRIAEWLWVPVVLAAVGAAMVFALRAGITFGDETDGFVPTWVVGVAAIVPATVVVLLGWRAAEAVESDVVRAFDRRTGTNSSFTRRNGTLAKVFADDGPNHVALRAKGHIRQIPGGDAIGTVIVAAMAGLALLSVVGAVVMYLFWQERNDGVLLQRQIDRAWDVLTTLQTAERTIAFVTLGVATLWTAVTVINVRLASARRRNPMLAALAWPAAGAGIWMVGDRMVSDGSAQQVVVGFAIQAVLLYVPFALLERSADAVGARRNPIRLAAAIGVVLLVQIQGLGGLSTLTPSTDTSELGPLVGYLAVGALVKLLATFAVADATRSLGEMTAHVADTHNDLVAQRAEARPRPEPSSTFIPERV